MEKEIRRVRSAKDIVISLLFAVAGIAAIILGTASIFILGVVLLVFGMILFVFLRSDYIVGAEKTCCRKITIDCANANKESVAAFISNETSKFEPGEGTGGAILYVYVAKDKSCGYAQLIEFSQYQYRPYTDICPLNEKQVAAIVK